MHDSVNRFLNRAENYAKYRPHYPKEIISYLQEEINLTSENVIADIGSGTGISAELFLENGNTIYGVEPNNEMRECGENYLNKHKNFISINGSAEETHLENDSIDVIVCGQAFHWFDLVKAKIEFKRILRENGYAVLIWNIRRKTETPFLVSYEELQKKFGINYPVVSDKWIEENDDNSFVDFYSPNGFTIKTFENYEFFDFDGLKGRLFSFSYIPTENREMIEELKRIYDKYNKNGLIKMEYNTMIYSGKLK